MTKNGTGMDHGHDGDDQHCQGQMRTVFVWVSSNGDSLCARLSWIYLEGESCVSPEQNLFTPEFQNSFYKAELQHCQRRS